MRMTKDWTYLPRELLDVILDRLIHLSDYIRFAAVCKSWRCVAIDQKQKRTTTTPPILLLTNQHWDGSKLYFISDGKFYSHEFGFRGRSVCLGSCYGWLAIQEKHSAVMLFNPFTQKSIHIPGVGLDRDTTTVPRYSNLSIQKVILSGDPSTHPDDFVLAAIYDHPANRRAVAFIRPGQSCWRFADVGNVSDIIFHNGFLLAVDDCHPSRLTAFDYKCNHHNRLAPRFQIVAGKKVRKGKSRTIDWSYLVESSKGNLLRVKRILRINSNTRRNVIESMGDFEVYKLESKKKTPSSNKEEVDWVEIHELENNDAIFLAHNHSSCISASIFPKCDPNSIYFTHSFRCEAWSWNWKSDSHIGIFHMGNRTIREHGVCGLIGSEIAVWISPTLFSSIAKGT